MSTEVERIAALETRMADVDSTLKDMDKKLDDLLALKNKGMGAFWLASILIGSIFTGLVTFVSDLFKG